MKYLLPFFVWLFVLSMNNIQEGMLNKDYGIGQENLDISDAPDSLLANLEKIGVDDNDLLNDYEITFFQFIFNLKPEDVIFKGKRVYFVGGKKRFFYEEKERFYHGQKDGLGCTTLFILNESQREEVNGYDMIIDYRPPARIMNRSIKSVIRGIKKAQRR